MNVTKPAEINMAELEEVLARATTAALSEDDVSKLKVALHTLLYLTELVEDRKTTIQKLRQMLFGASTENLDNVRKQVLKTVADHVAAATTSDGGKTKQVAKGHGKNGAEDYTGGTKVVVKHDGLKYGQCCPECEKGKLYNSVKPGYLVRIVGQAPLGATVYELEKLRCNLCGEVFTAKQPEGVGAKKYDESSGAMIGLLKYSNGQAFNRLEELQGNMGIPLPASTQWEIVKEVAETVKPAHDELIRQAAQGDVFYNDDTDMTVLSLIPGGTKPEDKAEQPEECQQDTADGKTSVDPAIDLKRKGVFTSGIVSTSDEHKIALFFTGHSHAGENLGSVLKRRALDLEPPIQMCDALARNIPQELETIVANCMSHGRRKFVDVASRFPDECLHVLKILAEVYRNDALAKQQKMSPQQRLALHQAESGPRMEELKQWLEKQLKEHKVEPNSSLGKAIRYMITHWSKLTLFLRVAGAPLDNNTCERALKKAILHRKNALFYKSDNGAIVGDIFMSLIHSCRLCGTNAFDYLVQLQKHSSQLASCPEKWMPWNYRENLQHFTP